MRTTLDEHSKTIQDTQPVYKRNYNDAEFYREDSPPIGLPDWAYASAESSEEIEQGKGKGKAKEGESKGKEKEKPKRKPEKESARSPPKRQRITDYEQSVMYSEEEEHRTGETATTGMIRGALQHRGALQQSSGSIGEIQQPESEESQSTTSSEVSEEK